MPHLSQGISIVFENEMDHELARISTEFLDSFDIPARVTNLRDITPGRAGFHYIHISDVARYLEACAQIRSIGVDSSAPNGSEVTKLQHVLSKIPALDDVIENGAELYTTAYRRHGEPVVLAPVMRELRYHFFETDSALTTEFIFEVQDPVLPPTFKPQSVGSTDIEYNLIEKGTPLEVRCVDCARKVYEELGVTTPLLIGFNVNDSGDLFLSEVMINFGLTAHSFVPTILKHNGISISRFLKEAYLLR